MHLPQAWIQHFHRQVVFYPQCHPSNELPPTHNNKPEIHSFFFACLFALQLLSWGWMMPCFSWTCRNLNFFTRNVLVMNFCCCFFPALDKTWTDWNHKWVSHISGKKVKKSRGKESRAKQNRKEDREGKGKGREGKITESPFIEKYYFYWSL